jgi:hypothetical protein
MVFVQTTVWMQPDFFTIRNAVSSHHGGWKTVGANTHASIACELLDLSETVGVALAIEHAADPKEVQMW